MMFSQAQCRSIVVDSGSMGQLDAVLSQRSDRLVVIVPDLDDVQTCRERWTQHLFLSLRELASPNAWQEPPVEPDAIAYLLFTSGSTGIPKGVMISRRNVRAFVDHVTSGFEITEQDAVSQMFDLTFDLSAFDMFVSWERGACVFCPSQKSLINPAQFIRDRRLTVWFSVPSTIAFMKQLGTLKPQSFPSLRLSLFCGEPLPISCAETWLTAAPNSALENLYGPTELTIACTSYKWHSTESPRESELGIVHRSLNGYLIAGSPSHASKIFDEYAAHGVEIHKIVVAILPENLSSAAWGEIKRISRQRRIALEILPERLLLSPSSKKLAQIHSGDFRHERSSTSGRWVWKLKRIVDILFAAAVLIVVSPLAIIVALLVLVDVGYPVVFWQQRLGRFGRPLHVYKFRTMRAPFDRKGHPVPDSERLSPVGQFLRATRLDEIPQLWNVLTGEMSVVGPRPLLPIDQPNTYSTRLDVRPGLTGLAQISGGKLLSIEEKDAFDEHYVRHGSIFLDFSILARTLWVMLRGDRRNEAIIAGALAEKHGKAKKTILRTREISSEPLPASGEGALLMAGGGS
jgi:lipopolysaccharide/colanic/teichoic acid biosynthesis glycosyltransferase